MRFFLLFMVVFGLVLIGWYLYAMVAMAVALLVIARQIRQS